MAAEATTKRTEILDLRDIVTDRKLQRVYCQCDEEAHDRSYYDLRERMTMNFLDRPEWNVHVT